MMKHRIAISLVLALLTALPFSVARVSLAAPTSAKASLEKATRMLDQVSRDKKKRKFRSSWEGCIARFDRIIKDYPSSAYAGDAAYHKAQAFEGMYRVSRVRADQDSALAAYQFLIESYPDNSNIDDALYNTATVYLERGDRELAAGYYRLLAAGHPKNPRAKEALAKLEKLPKPAAQPPARRIEPLPEPEPEPELRPAATVQDQPTAVNTPAEATGASQPVAATPAPAGLAVVKGVRFWSGRDKTRLVVDMDGESSFEYGRLTNPDRLFFDLKKSSLASSLKDAPIEINDGVVRTVRASQYDNDTVRVVLDLGAAGDVDSFMLAGPARMVIDVQKGAGGSATAPSSTSASRRRSGSGRYITVRNTSPAPPQPEISVQEAEKPQATPAAKAPEPAARPAQVLPPLQVRPASTGLDIIVIDPGHGGHDSGAVGKGGLKEKDVVLDIGRRLRDLIEDRLGCKVIMTRDRDVFVELDERPRLASQRGASLFLSIHANASKNRSANGIETYLLNTTKDRYIMEVAAAENMMTMDKMGALDVILADLVLLTKRPESLKLAHAVQASLVGGLKKPARTVNDKGVKQGPFLVLYGADMPSILTEVGFISNPEEEKLLGSESYRQEVAEAILEGIREYVKNSDVITANR